MVGLKERIEASFGSQGLMETLGASLVHVSAGEVHISLMPSPKLTQQHGFLHAGALTSIADSACGYSALTLADPGLEVLTVEFKVNFLRPAVAELFVAEAKVVKPGKTLAVCLCDIIAKQKSKRTSVALMQATIMNMPRHE